MGDVSLNLIVLRSPNIERTAHFYSLLGIRFKPEQHGSGPEHLAARVGPTVLEVYPLGDEPYSHGVRLGFQVPSLNTVVEAVSQEGGTILSPPHYGLWGYRAVLADPDGRRVEVSEYENTANPKPGLHDDGR